MHPIHTILGYLGLIPFIGLSALHIYQWLPAYELLVTYSALILSFLAGLLWMSAMDTERSIRLAIASKGIVLASWALLYLNPGHVILYAFSLLFILLYLFETLYLKSLYPSGFFSLRSRLTVITTLSLFSAEMFS